jgi:predicted secreted protein
VAIAAKIITTAAIAAITIGLFYCLAWMAHRAFA